MVVSFWLKNQYWLRIAYKELDARHSGKGFEPVEAMSYYFVQTPPFEGFRTEPMSGEMAGTAFACCEARGFRMERSRVVYVYRFPEVDIHNKMELEIMNYAPETDIPVFLEAMRSGAIYPPPLDRLATLDELEDMMRKGKISRRTALRALGHSPRSAASSRKVLHSADRLYRMLKENTRWPVIGVAKGLPSDFWRHYRNLRGSVLLELFPTGKGKDKSLYFRPKKHDSLSNGADNDTESITFTSE